MSGPKTSRYVLTDALRKRIEEHQRIIRETKIAQDKRDSLQRKNVNYLSSINDSILELKKLCSESGMGEIELDFITKEITSIKNQLNDITKADNLGVLDILNKENKSLEQMLVEMQRIKTESKELALKISVTYKQKLSGIIADSFELSFSGLGEQRKLKENLFIQKINRMLNCLEVLELPDYLMEKFYIIKKRANEIRSIDFLENFCSMQVYPFIHECEFYSKHISIFEDLLRLYAYLTEEVGIPAKLFVFSEENIERLKKEVSTLQQIMMSQKEEEYISTTIDEIMIEMGYQLVGERSVVKKSGKRFKNNLYTLDEGTAVNVTFSDSGQISMEVGALDVSDRMPTETEASDLVDDMKAFCDDYVTLERKLVERGITTKRVAILPALSEYAQVFNIDDYEMKRSVEIYRKSKMKTTFNKQRHKEG